MGCTWGENMSWSGDKGVQGEPGELGKKIPSGFIEHMMAQNPKLYPSPYEATKAAQAAMWLPSEELDCYQRQSVGDLRSEVTQLGKYVLMISNKQETISQAQHLLLRNIGEVLSQLMSMRQQISILTEQIEQLEEKQRETEKKIPVDPFSSTQRRRPRVIKRMAQ